MEPLLNPTTKTALEATAKAPTGAYGFIGPAGSGRRTAAIWLTSRLNCQQGGCGQCGNCNLVKSGNFPDLVSLHAEGQSLGISQINEMKEALELKPYYAGGWRVVIVEDAEALTPQAQNALLKILEEPPEQTIFVLLAEHFSSLLQTVQSRLKPVFFAPVSTVTLASWLQSHHGLAGEAASRIAATAEGLPGLAVQLIGGPEEANDEASEQDVFGMELFERLLLAQQLTQSPEKLLIMVAAKLRLKLRQVSDSPDQARRTASQLAAVARARQYLQANVNARAALEGLMLEL